LSDACNPRLTSWTKLAIITVTPVDIGSGVESSLQYLVSS
jgi:hypothetical protein